MTSQDTDKSFAGSIPKLYETYLVPLIFEPYAMDIAERLAARSVNHVLEVAAGTGVVTRALDSAMPDTVSIVATDLNQPMLDHAATLQRSGRAITWQQADAMQLPFEDETFDAVVCQFGVMFFPDKSEAYAETRRVLKPGGMFVFNVWDHIKQNELADTVTLALEQMFPEDPPRFLARTPYGYHDHEVIAGELAAAGFDTPPKIDAVSARSRAPSCEQAAMAFCEGTPLRNEIEARDPTRLAEATSTATQAMAQRFGRGKVDAKIQAFVVTVQK